MVFHLFIVLSLACPTGLLVFPLQTEVNGVDISQRTSPTKQAACLVNLDYKFHLEVWTVSCL